MTKTKELGRKTGEEVRHGGCSRCLSDLSFGVRAAVNFVAHFLCGIACLYHALALPISNCIILQVKGALYGELCQHLLHSELQRDREAGLRDLQGEDQTSRKVKYIQAELVVSL